MMTCKVVAATDRYHTCASSNPARLESQMVGRANVSKREALERRR